MLVKAANEHYKSGNYEAAAEKYTQALAGQSELTETERRDLMVFIQQNQTALSARREGAAQLRLADEAVRLGKTLEAGNLLKIVTANQYLSQDDRIKLSNLNEQLRTRGTASAKAHKTMADPRPTLEAKSDVKSLLAAARTALQKGDYDLAETWVVQAEKANTGLTSWVVTPWSDSPSKVRREIQSARAKSMPMPVAKDTLPEKKEGGSVFPSVKNLFGSRTKEKDKADDPIVVKGPDLPKEVTPPPSFKNPETKTPGTLVANPKQNDVTQIHTTAKPVLTGSNTEMSRQLMKESRKALDKGDMEAARRFAFQAKELHADFFWWEENPEKLLADINRREKRDAVAVKPGAAKTDVSKSVDKAADPRVMLKEARALLQQEKFDDADNLCVQAGKVAGARWGLFEDSPDKVRRDIQKQRAVRDRDESAKLLAEARKLQSQGNYLEAKRLAYQSQKLHGPYTIWDLGDRPQKLIDEIQRLEIKRGASFDMELAKDKEPSKTNGNDGPKVADNKPILPPPPPVDPNSTGSTLIGTAAAAAKSKAIVLVAEAREHQKRGQLVEARQKALEAQRMAATFGAEEDSPERALLSLAALCDRQVQQMLSQAVELVQNSPQDAGRFQKADAVLAQARTLAQAFGQDVAHIEQRMQWVRQVASAGTVNPTNAVAKEKENVITAGGNDTLDQAKRQIGLEKLEKARLELKAGNTPMALRIAQEMCNPMYGVKAEALTVIRSIEAEEHNQRILQAHRTADAGFEAYARRDYRQAASIFTSLDLSLLAPERARRISDVLSQKEMQPDAVLQVVDKVPSIDPKTSQPVKTAGADLGAGDDLTARVKAMEEIQFQKLRERALQAQKSSMELFKSGNKFRALEVLKDYLEQVNQAELSEDRIALLKRQVENRMQQYRTMMASELLSEQQQKDLARFDEGKRITKVQKTQNEVAELVKQANSLMKEGKYKEALAQAQLAHDLDNDNIAAQIIMFQAGVQDTERRNKDMKARNEKGFLNDLAMDFGARPEAGRFDFDPDIFKKAQKRADGKEGFWSKTKNPIEREIERKLQQQYPINFRDLPLYQVLDDLTKMTGINVVPNRRALQEAGISLDMPVSQNLEGISLKAALRIMLDNVRLTYVIRNEVLEVTTPQDAAGQRRQVVYPVADLVVPVENHPVSPINDFNSALTRHIMSQSGIVMQPPTPVLGPNALVNGQPVSYAQGGIGSAFAASQPRQAGQVSAVQQRAPGQTIEDLLITLIQNSVAPNTWSNVGGEGTIQYFPLGLALVISQQTQEVQEEVAALLASLRKLLDLEVAIEMRLVSVSEAFFERMGMDFDVNFRTGTSRREVDLLGSNFTPFGNVNRNNDRLNMLTGVTPAGTLTPDLNIPIRNSSFDFSVPPFGGYPGTLGADGGLSLGLAFLSDIQVFMFLDAAQGDRRTNVMQAPKITVFNGQTAQIAVNDQQFFLTSIQLAQANAQLFFAPQNQPFPLGVTLQVTPVVSADRRFVRLNLTPSMTNLASATVPLIPLQVPVPQVFEGPGNGNTTTGQPTIFQMFFQQPTFSTITVNTTVNVPDGGTVLLGGLKTLSESRNEFGPPILSKIPYLSRLFKNVGYGREGQSLMIMVTPRIIITEEEELIFTGALPPIPR